MELIEDGVLIKVELTRRNLETLLEKLDDPLSTRTLLKSGSGKVLTVTAVENDDHYSDRAPGAVYMPSTNEYK